MEPGLAAMVVAALAPGCGGSNALPVIPVPTADVQAPLPRWYPEAPWTASAGQSRVFLEGKIGFEVNSASLGPGSDKVLKTLLQFMNEHPEVTLLRVEGHADASESKQQVQALSEMRALAVCDWLVDHSVDPARLVAVGFGASRPLGPPLVPNERADARQDNRQTEFHVAEIRGRPFVSGEKGAKDPTAGANILAVKSAEERRQEREKEHYEGQELEKSGGPHAAGPR